MHKPLLYLCAVLMIISASVMTLPAKEFRRIDLPTRYLIGGPTSESLYASMPSSAGVLSNCIVSIDPATGALGTAVFVGSEPGHLAISDDGTTLYANLDGAFAIRQIDLTTMTAGIQFSLGSHPSYGPYQAEDIEVQPGDPDVLAVSRVRPGISPRHGGVAIFDNGVQRVNTTQQHTGSNRIEFSDNSSIVYGYNNESTEWGFRKLRVDPDGVTQLTVWQNFISGFYVDIEFHGGRIYATNGRVLDPAGPTILGTYSGVGNAQGLVVDDDENCVYFLVSDYYDNYYIKIFDLTTFVLLDVIPLPLTEGYPSNLVQWGPGALAFRTETQVFFIDLKADPPDADGDGIADDYDNCPHTANSSQADLDGDEIGDACDPFPNDPNNEAAQCGIELDDALEKLDDALEELDTCLTNHDEDNDGEATDTDRCPTTPNGLAVDDSGCSRAQFCGIHTTKKACVKADWKNDEPAIGNPKDCIAVKLENKTISCQSNPED